MKSVYTSPTPAQREVGNYKKGHTTFHGLDISIENPRGWIRRGVNDDGEPWAHRMLDDYGYIKRTEGADGDQVDVFVGPNKCSRKVFIIDQLHDGDKFDEHKCMLGYDSFGQALNTLRRSYGKTYDKAHHLAGATEMDIDTFKSWVRNGNTKRPLSTQTPMASGGAVDDAGDVYQDGGTVEQAATPESYFGGYLESARHLFGDDAISHVMRAGGAVLPST